MCLNINFENHLWSVAIAAKETLDLAYKVPKSLEDVQVKHMMNHMWHHSLAPCSMVKDLSWLLNITCIIENNKLSNQFVKVEFLCVYHKLLCSIKCMFCASFCYASTLVIASKTSAEQWQLITNAIMLVMGITWIIAPASPKSATLIHYHGCLIEWIHMKTLDVGLNRRLVTW